MHKLKLKVPATSANLACGFDTLGIALALYNSYEVALSDKLSFSGCEESYCNRNNLAYRAFAAVYSSLGLAVPEIALSMHADIPISRGLGSSAAMIVGGALAANELLERPYSRAELLSVINPIEGHPDNLAPALFGGLVASSVHEDRVYSVSYPVHPSLCFTVLSPDFTLSTERARAALPKSVSFKDACYDLPRLAMLPRAMESGDLELLSFCLDDRLHQSARASLIAGYAELEALARSIGYGCICISGAGPSVLCISDSETLSEALSREISRLPNSWTPRRLSVDSEGARLD